MPEPTEIRLEKARGILVVEFDDGQTFEMSCQYLRTHSPSAEVRGHGLTEPMLLTGKENVAIDKITPVGSYAVCLHFDDGHNTGIYSWPILYDLGANMEMYQARYDERLREEGLK
ncbi:MAG: gamma-butyrobetaine hydroxylase-like domain-containing protein [Wenzhouxiangella sp.]|jgi:DUF971 family protein|nr:gamma-butyrobetaine hydroxylase-like domain-containing protein [Wenzhouxiangella sp.]